MLVNLPDRGAFLYGIIATIISSIHSCYYSQQRCSNNAFGNAPQASGIVKGKRK